LGEAEARHAGSADAQSLGRLRERFGGHARVRGPGRRSGQRVAEMLAASGLGERRARWQLAGLYLSRELPAEHPALPQTRFASDAARLRRRACSSSLDVHGTRRALRAKTCGR
jgi:hypothetical protein